MLRRKILSEAELDRIAEATRQAELNTSGEIATVITSRAGAYTGHVLLAGTVMLFVLSVAYLTFIGPIGEFLRRFFWAFETRHALWALLVVQAAVFILTYVLLSAWPGLKRLFISKKDMLEKVRRRAASEFFHHHISSTKGGTGVLIFVALFERRVELLVDSGIAKVIPQQTWRSVVDEIIAGIKKRAFVDVLCGQVVRCGQTLSKDFPRKADDVNELSDRPVVE